MSSESLTPRTCLFCPRTDLTLEHVWPDWTSRFLLGQPRKGRLRATATGTDRKAERSWEAPELNHKARIVCDGCNRGWMSDVESSADPILKPMLKGREVQLGEFEQVTIAAWITLRTMILERAATVRNPKHYYTTNERRTFAYRQEEHDREDSLEPPLGMYIWLFRYRSHQWLARTNVANLGFSLAPTEPSHHTQVITAFVGQFGFQTMTCRWPTSRHLELSSPRVRLWEPATRLLWPAGPNAIDWPPEYLADDTLEPFMDRWKEGIPLNCIKLA